MRYQHIVWDWNGTLLDDLWLCIDSINSVLSSRNMKQVNKKSYRIDYEDRLNRVINKFNLPIVVFSVKEK